METIRLCSLPSQCMMPSILFQFHPESVATKFGKQILANFYNITVEFQQTKDYRKATNVRFFINCADFSSQSCCLVKTTEIILIFF